MSPMRPLAVVEQHILELLRQTPQGLHYAGVHQRLTKHPEMRYLSASRVLTHLQRLHSLSLITSHADESHKPATGRARLIYQARIRPESPSPSAPVS